MNPGVFGLPQGGASGSGPDWGAGGAGAPIVTQFTHTVPEAVASGATVSVSFSGASSEAGEVQYAIDPVSSGATFSKTAGIAAGEVVQMTAPATAEPALGVTFSVYAVSGGVSVLAGVVAVTVVGQVLWEFTSAGIASWSAPVSGRYELTVVGGGGGGGAGGHPAFYDRHGASGGASSVGTLVTALGGWGGACGATGGLGDGHGGNGGSAGGGGVRPGSGGYIASRTPGRAGLGAGSGYYSALQLTPSAAGGTSANDAHGAGGFNGASTQELAESYGGNGWPTGGGGGGGCVVSVQLSGDGKNNLADSGNNTFGYGGRGYGGGGGGGATQSGWGGGGGGSGYADKSVVTIAGGTVLPITVGAGGAGGVRASSYHGDGGAGASGYVRIKYVGGV